MNLFEIKIIALIFEIYFIVLGNLERNILTTDESGTSFALNQLGFFVKSSKLLAISDLAATSYELIDMSTGSIVLNGNLSCLLYTSDAADD